MKSFLPTKLNLDDDQIGKALEKAANPQKVNDDFIAPAAEDPNVEQANDDTFLIDERMRSEAETVQKLPKTFPIEEWEKMTTKQQKKALEFSGLTEQEQWKILNVGAPLNALAHYPTRMYAMTDAKTNSGGPLKLEKTSTDDQEPRTATPNNDDVVVIEMAHEPGSIEDQAHKALYEWVEGLGLDTWNLTAEQKKILDDAEKRIVRYAEWGSLTDALEKDILIETGNKIAALPSSAENPIRYYIEMVDKSDQAPLKEKTKTRAEKVAEAVANSKYGDYVEDTYNRFHDEFVKALRRGDVTRDDYQDYFDVVEEVVYENTEKPIPVITKEGRKKITKVIPIGELISPYDNSFGAQIVREAMKLIGVKYNEPAMQGLKSKMDIDCSRLVNWAVTEVNPFWGEYGIGKGARHQIYQSDVIWNSESLGKFNPEKLRVGDTLFWRGDETDKVTHTAIYIGTIDGRLLMIESGNGGVHIEEIRMETHNSNGEGSTLVQVNRMTPERMQENAEENQGSH